MKGVKFSTRQDKVMFLANNHMRDCCEFMRPDLNPVRRKALKDKLIKSLKLAKLFSPKTMDIDCYKVEKYARDVAASKKP